MAGDPVGANNGTYVIVWNGHGDATGLWQIKTDGTLEKANTFTYDTWGRPARTVYGAYTDLGFRYLYVGAADVRWDDAYGAGLLYMHARSYSPTLGRFLQPDPIAAEGNLYGYAENSPVTKTDASGTWACLIPFIGWSVCATIVRVALAVITSPRVITFLTGLGLTIIRFGQQASLSIQRLGHIIIQHGQAITNATLIARDGVRVGLESTTRFLSNSQIPSLIQATLRSPTTGRTVEGVLEYARRFSYAVGTDGYGHAQYWVRVIISQGQIISAYPASRPFR